jgi:hypothetical protein
MFGAGLVRVVLDEETDRYLKRKTPTSARRLR